jgi:hypothetical protein
MVGFPRVEDERLTLFPPRSRVYLAAITAATAAIMIGYDSAFFGFVHVVFVEK